MSIRRNKFFDNLQASGIRYTIEDLIEKETQQEGIVLISGERDDSLPSKAFSHLGPEYSSTPTSYLVRLRDHKDVRLIKNSYFLMKKIGSLLATEFLSMDTAVISFRSIQCYLNDMVSLNMGPDRACTLGKWAAGTLYWKEHLRSRFVHRDLSIVRSINDVPGRQRIDLDLLRTAGDYFKTYNPATLKESIDRLKEWPNIILLDDTLNSGASMALFTEILKHMDISEDKIHKLVLLEEQ